MAIGSNHEISFVGFDRFSRRQGEDRGALGDLVAWVRHVQAHFFEQFPFCGLLEAFAGFDPAAGRSPETLAC